MIASNPDINSNKVSNSKSSTKFIEDNKIMNYINNNETSKGRMNLNNTYTTTNFNYVKSPNNQMYSNNLNNINNERKENNNMNMNNNSKNENNNLNSNYIDSSNINFNVDNNIPFSNKNNENDIQFPINQNSNEAPLVKKNQTPSNSNFNSNNIIENDNNEKTNSQINSQSTIEKSVLNSLSVHNEINSEIQEEMEIDENNINNTNTNSVNLKNSKENNNSNNSINNRNRNVIVIHETKKELHSLENPQNEEAQPNTPYNQEDSSILNNSIFYPSTPIRTPNPNDNQINVTELNFNNNNNTNNSNYYVKEIKKLSEGKDSYVNILEEQLEKAIEKIDNIDKDNLNKKVLELQDQIKFEVSLKEEGFKDYENKMIALQQKCQYLIDNDKLKSKEIETSLNALKDIKQKYEQEIKKKESYKRQVNKVYSDNVKMKKDNENYKYKVDQLTDELKKMANKIETLESNELVYKAQIGNGNDDTETIKTITKEYEKKLNEKNKLLNAKEQENIQLKKDDENFKSSICKQLDSLFIDCKNKQANNQSIIEEKNKEISDINAKNKALIEENKVKKEEIKRLSDTINKHFVDYNTLKLTLEKREAEYKLKEKEIEELSRKYTEITKNQGLLNAENSNNTIEKKKNMEILNEYKVKLEKLNNQLNKTLKELDDLKKKFENKNAELKDLSDKNKFLNKITEDNKNLTWKNKELHKSLEEFERYKEEGKQKEHRIMKLNQEIGNLKNIINRNKEKDVEIGRLNRMLEEEKKRKNEIYEQKEEKIKELYRKIDELNLYEKKFKEKANEVEKLTLQIKTLDNEKTLFQTKEKNLNEELLALASENKIRDEEIERYVEDISTLRNNEREFKQKEEQFIGRIQELKGNEIKYKQEFMRKEDYWQAKIKELTNYAQGIEISKNKEIRGKNEEIKNLTKNLESINNEMSIQEEKHKEEINQMKKDLEIKNNELDTLNTEYKKKKKELGELRDKLDQNDKEIKLLKQTNGENIEILNNLNNVSKKEIEDWKQKYAKINEELEKVKNILEIKKGELNSAHKSIDDKEKKLELSNKAYQKSKEDIEKYTLQIEQLKQKYISDNKELELLKQKCYIKEREIEDTNNKLLEKENTIKDLNGKILMTENEIINLGRTNSKLEMLNASLLTKENSYIGQINKLKDQYEKLEQSRNRIKDDNNSLREKITELNESNFKQEILIKQELNFKKEKEKLSKEKEKLSKENEKLINNIHEYEIASVSCLQQLRTVTSELNIAKNKIEELKEKLEATKEERNEIEELKEKLEAAREEKGEIEKLKEILELSKEEKREIEKIIEKNNIEIKMLTKQLSILQIEKKKLEEQLKKKKLLDTKENLVIISDNNKNGKSKDLDLIANENFNLMYKTDKISKECRQLKTINKQLNKIIENLKFQLSSKDNEILTEKIKQDKYKSKLDIMQNNYSKEINQHLLELKIKDIELKDYILKYNNLKREVNDNSNNNSINENINIKEEIMDIKKELEKNLKIEIENEKNIYKKEFERELIRKEESMDKRIRIVEMKADEEVEIYRKKLLEKTKNEVEEFRKNYDIIQLNEIHQKEKELEQKAKEVIIIKKQELVHQKDKAFAIKKHEIETAFNKLIKVKQQELEEKYQNRVMNLKLIVNNTPQLNTVEASRAVVKIINDLKEEIISLNKNLSLEKQINENNYKKIKLLEQNHKDEVEELLKSHFNNIDGNTIFNNKTLSLFNKNYLEKLYTDITNKMKKDINQQESENNDERSSNSLNKKSYMEKRLNEIFASFQIYTWKLHYTIEEYENQIKNINRNRKIDESASTILNDEFVKRENKFKLLLKEKEAEYLRILTELELDNYIKETKLIEDSLLNSNSFDNLHYEERLKVLEAQYQSCMKVIDDEKKSSISLTNENKKLRQKVEKDRRTIEYDNKLLKKYRKQVNFLEKTLNMETQGSSKVIQNYIHQIHQGKGKHRKTKTVEFVNTDGMVNAYNGRKDEQRTDGDNRQKDRHSELTTGDFITSLNTDHYNTREYDSKGSENKTKIIDTINLDSDDTTTPTIEVSKEINSEVIKKEDDDDDETDNNSSDNNDSENSDQDNENNNSNGDSDIDDSNESDDISMSIDGSKKKKTKKGKMKYSKKGKDHNYNNKIYMNKNDFKMFKSSKINKRKNDSNEKEETISKKSILQEENNNIENNILNNNKDNNKSLKIFDDNLESSEEEEEVSERIKEEIKSLLEDIPELKNKYYISNKTGEGTFSSVYKALRIDEEKKRKDDIKKKRENKFYSKKITNKKYYALKRIYATSSPQRIENEISILHDLRKKSNIVSIYSCVRYEDQVILVLPYIQHNDFRDYLPTMTMNDIRYYMISILTALKHCHELYIMHRDIKPSNFLYDIKNKSGVLVDFGLAQRMDGEAITAYNAARKTISTNTCNKRSLEESNDNINSESHSKKLKTDRKFSKTLKSNSLVNLDSSNSSNNSIIDNNNDNNDNDNNINTHSNSNNSNKNIEENNNCEKDSQNNENRYVLDINNEIPVDIPTFNNGKIHPLSVMATVPKYGKPGYIKNDVRPPIRANRAGTRGFRAPEVLFKCVHQTVAIDIWSVGVILLSMFTQRFPFFNSNDDYEALLELGCIFGKQRMKYVAYILERTYETNIPSIDQFVPFQKLCQNLNPKKVIPKEGIEFLSCLLTLDPKARITAKEALEHPFLKNFDEEENINLINEDKT